MLQQTIGKTSSRSTHIHARVTRWIDFPVLQRSFQFQPAAPDVSQIIAQQPNLRIRLNICARLLDLLLVHHHATGQDHRLGAFPRRNQTSLHEQFVDS